MNDTLYSTFFLVKGVQYIPASHSDATGGSEPGRIAVEYDSFHSFKLIPVVSEQRVTGISMNLTYHLYPSPSGTNFSNNYYFLFLFEGKMLGDDIITPPPYRCKSTDCHQYY